MLFHVIPRPPPPRTEVNQLAASRPKLMPRYHYSKLVTTPTSTTETSASDQREFIPIPITRENGTTNTSFISLLRPSSRYFHDHPSASVSRRSSLTLPVLTSVAKSIPTEETQPFSSVREIPIRFPPSNCRPVLPVNLLQRQKSEVSSSSIPPSSDFTVSSPIRRAEVMAREAIQHLARLQYEQRNQSAMSNARSPATSRRVIINLQNNPSVSLERRVKSPAPLAPSPFLFAREKSNVHVIPVLQQIQLAEALPTNSHANSVNYKNEFHIEIPVTITTTTNNNNEQENHLDERNYPLKSILKRSSSRDAVTRKNVSFLNA